MDVNRLISLREGKGWSKTEAARRLNIANSTYSGYEYGHRKPDNEMLVKISELYDVTTDYLLGKTDSENFSSDDFDSFMFDNKEAFDSLPDDVKKELIREINEKIEFLKYKQNKDK
ncbi:MULTISPECIES: helix-turn-helix domain-containing protein [Jeotgalicoccus]|uniref:helix-turn-helix domain-containing protein n=1 Tax=Jeotgalicoccus TaxID=227979 RepID=UPI00040F7ACF|nr:MULTISPECIES: helix-turn-helix transcriptional regulator [Jeotgalicoccus]